MQNEICVSCEDKPVAGGTSFCSEQCEGNYHSSRD